MFIQRQSDRICANLTYFDCIFRAVVITAYICEDIFKVAPLKVAKFAISSSLQFLAWITVMVKKTE